MRKWTLRWKLPEFACKLWLVLLVSRVCVCDGDQAAVTDCFKHERHTRNYDYMEGGDVRIRRLYSRTQWFLMIDEFGNINGTQDPNNCYSKSVITRLSEVFRFLLCVRSFTQDVCVSSCVRAGLCLCFRRSGDQDGFGGRRVGYKRTEEPVLYFHEPHRNVTGQSMKPSIHLFFFPGQKDYNDSCNFKEVFLENYYTAYSSVKWTKNGKEMFISLSQKGRPLRGKKTRKESISSHFIPRKCREDEKKLA